jgi:hypothetical protein
MIWWDHPNLFNHVSLTLYKYGSLMEKAKVDSRKINVE